MRPRQILPFRTGAEGAVRNLKNLVIPNRAEGAVRNLLFLTPLSRKQKRRSPLRAIVLTIQTNSYFAGNNVAASTTTSASAGRVMLCTVLVAFNESLYAYRLN
jgi:hypothetical protein